MDFSPIDGQITLELRSFYALSLVYSLQKFGLRRLKADVALWVGSAGQNDTLVLFRSADMISAHLLAVIPAG